MLGLFRTKTVIPKILRILVMVLAGHSTTHADLVYSLVSQDALQSGFTLSGHIIVADSAPDDGFLQSEEFVSWTWTATNGVTTVSSSSSDAIDPPGVFGSAWITTDEIFLPDGGSFIGVAGSGQFVLEEESSVTEVGWHASGPSGVCIYQGMHEGTTLWRFGGSESDDEGLECWEALDNRVVVATAIPEPSAFACMGLVGLAGVGLIWYRDRRNAALL